MVQKPPANLLTVTVISSTNPATLSKQYELIDGQLQKTTIADMSAGNAEIKTLANLHEFSELLQSLNHNQALTYGVPQFSPAKIITKSQFIERNEPSGYLTRTKGHFEWPKQSAGILMLDYDPANDDIPKTPEELLTILQTAVPTLVDVPHVRWCSSSSHIINEQEIDLTGLKGQRFYIPVIDATDIPRAGKVLVELLWVAGFGHYEVGNAGQLLERCPVDASVWQPNRLDFASGAACIAPLRQDRGVPVVVDGEPIDTLKIFPEPTEYQKAQALSHRAKAKAAQAEQSALIRYQYIESKAVELTKNSGELDFLDDARATIRRALDNAVLTGEFKVILDNGESFSIGEILDDPARFHGKLTLDPIEPEYLGHKVVGKLYLIGGRPCLHSFAHGGKTYRLIRQPRRIELIKGRTHDAVLETLVLLRQLPDVYDFGGALVSISDGQALPMDEAHLTHWLGGQIQYWHWGKTRQGITYEVLDDPPPKVIKALLSMQNTRGLKPLDAVITAPTLRRDGSVISALGYDAASCIYIDVGRPLALIPIYPSELQVREALCYLMTPFKDFAFCSPLDRSIMLSALLTACLRPILPTAPGFGFDAPVQGSGKSLLAACVGVLATGTVPTVWPHTAGRDDEEVRKRIFTALRQGSRAIVWDNVTGLFDSASLASALTSPQFTDRVLGKSESLTVPNRALFMMTGNNLCLAGDMPRRILNCRINPDTETPFNRSFDLDPLAYVTVNRQRMVVAALTIVRGWLGSSQYLFKNTMVAGRMASFELWDSLVRQPVAWVNACIAVGEYADPMDAVIAAQVNDPEKDALNDLLIALQDEFGDDPFSAKDVVHTGIFGAVSPIQEALTDICNGKPISSAKSLGRVLKYREDKIVYGKSLNRAASIGNTSRWRIKRS
jgi:hypothetical protein